MRRSRQDFILKCLSTDRGSNLANNDRRVEILHGGSQNKRTHVALVSHLEWQKV